ncbi:MAG: hypothetical protein JWM31_898, partial [Solirubrobacterales bacterium]|nr:hypothetical protein [Solirubrobacterales bacterium]
MSNTRVVRPPPLRLLRSMPTQLFCLAALTCGAAIAGPASVAAAAATPVPLGTASAYALLAGSTATNTGPSTLNGDLGLFPGSAVTGFASPAKVNGAQHVNDSQANQAKADLGNAYDVAAGSAPTKDLPSELSGLRLTPGVYSAPSSVGISGPLTLDAQGDPAAVFIFQVGSALTTASASEITLVNGAQPCNVFWQIGSSATLGSGSTF